MNTTKPTTTTPTTGLFVIVSGGAAPLEFPPGYPARVEDGRLIVHDEDRGEARVVLVIPEGGWCSPSAWRNQPLFHP